jgi:hypothetical protein
VLGPAVGAAQPLAGVASTLECQATDVFIATPAAST